MPIEPPQIERCPFCRSVAGESEWSVIVEDTDDTLAFLNPRQFGKGHVLVIPKRHAQTVIDLDAAEAGAVYRHVYRLAHAIAAAFDPSGLNIFQNNGVSAGQMVPHYHVHIVPTYPGDTPGRIFHSADFEVTPLEQRREWAAAISRSPDGLT